MLRPVTNSGVSWDACGTNRGEARQHSCMEYQNSHRMQHPMLNGPSKLPSANMSHLISVILVCHVSNYPPECVTLESTTLSISNEWGRCCLLESSSHTVWQLGLTGSNATVITFGCFLCHFHNSSRKHTEPQTLPHLLNRSFQKQHTTFQMGPRKHQLHKQCNSVATHATAPSAWNQHEKDMAAGGGSLDPCNHNCPTLQACHTHWESGWTSNLN